MVVTNKSTENSELEQDKAQKRIGSLDQFQFVLYASKDKRLSACDLAVLIEITDRFLKKDGVTRPTGVSHLVRETGRNSKTVKASRAKLLNHHYLRVCDDFNGTTGTSYAPNFDWSSSVAETIKAEVDARKKAKATRKRAKSKSASGGLPTPTKKDELVGVSTPPLRDLVGVPTPPLGKLVGVSTPPQTYVSPTGELRRGTDTPLHDLGPVGGASPVEWEIVEAKIERAAGDEWIEMSLRDDEGNTDSASVVVEAANEDEQRTGQRTIAEFSAATGRDIEEPGDLLGVRLFFGSDCHPHPVAAQHQAAA